MNFMVRPSKSFLFDVLEHRLKNLQGEIGLDAGSANFKNRTMFKTGSYYGLDIDLEALKNGVAKYSDLKAFGILANLTKLDLLPKNSIDVIVSTNTLYILEPMIRLQVIKNLCQLTTLNGYFFCELDNDASFKDVLSTIRANFSKVEIIYYKNIFSRGYEKIFEKNGFLGTHRLAGTKPFRLIAWLISRIEYLTQSLPSPNKSVLIIASAKKSDEGRNNFDLSRFPLVNDRIYYLLS